MKLQAREKRKILPDLGPEHGLAFLSPLEEGLGIMSDTYLTLSGIAVGMTTCLENHIRSIHTIA